MLTRYLNEALEHAHYEMIKDEEPYYGEIPELPGVWASGVTLEACRRNLAEALEDWLLFSIAKSLPIPAIGSVTLKLPEAVAS
jgi:predicted RNase H-like HicB family nuclease